jgi:mRNA-degrading endonuclease RelE of RelBE toxin-antitoxin system
MLKMKDSASYKWFLRIEPRAQARFDMLQRATKFAIFRKLSELLVADDPYLLPYVEMLQGKSFDRIRKFRVGDYRVFFVIESVEMTVQEFTYKGKLSVLSIRDRKEAY